MPSKNDLSALKKTTTKPAILPTSAPRHIEKPKAVKSGRVGRPPKDKTEKRSYKVTLSLTASEGARLAEKAGLAGEATFLYAKLKESGLFD